MLPSSSRYDITPFIRTSYHTAQELNDPEYKQIEAKYAAELQTKISDPTTRQLFQNKVVAALFLDKVPKYLGTHHPDAKHVNRFGYSSSTFISMELIRYLSDIRHDPRLTKESQRFLDDWIAREHDYLGLAIIFDGWRSGNAEVMRGLAKGDVEHEIQFNAPEHEIKKVAAAIAHKLAHLKPGEKFKVLGGYNIHETRGLLKKEKDGTFTFYHFNTAALNESAEKYSHVSAELVSSPLFWEEFIKDKLGQSYIGKMLERFKQMGKKEWSSEEEKLLAKSLQRNNTCPAQAVEAELRYEKVLDGPTPEEGLIQYKLIKSLMVEQAVREEKGQIDPQLYQILESKERSKHRYLHWLQVVQNPPLYEQIRDAYVELIRLTNPFSDQLEAVENKLAHTHSEIRLLRFLDDFLQMRLGSVTPEQREIIFQKHAQLFKIGNTPILCLKNVESAFRIKDAVQRIVDSNKQNAGGIWKHLRSILHRMPTVIASYFETNLRSDNLTKEELIQLLRSYLDNDKTSNVVPVIKEMLTQQLISIQDLDSLINFSSGPLKEALLTLKQT